MLRDDVTQDAVRLLTAEYNQVPTNYPLLFKSKHLSAQVFARVWARLRLLHPNLLKEFPKLGNGYRVTRKVSLPDDFLEADDRE